LRVIADLHIHSKYSRATSREMNITEITGWADKKGIRVIGSGDFQHPAYFGELKNRLEPAEPGLFRIRGGKQKARVMLQTEISNIYKLGNKVRKVHTLVYMPDLKAAEKFSKALAERGNTASDGRPIFGFHAPELVKTAYDSSPDAMVIPAHAWTPWFSIFGAKSGFDSIEECFEDQARYIKAVETGLSSDPPMNWRVSALDGITLISNSDAHSPKKIGREANVFEMKQPDYFEIKRIIEEKDTEKFLYTIEFFPEEGKYHYDGHRMCGINYHPREAIAKKNRCPVCFKPLTMGVLHRIEELADRPWDYVPEKFVPFRSLVPLQEIIAGALGRGENTKGVQEEYEKMIIKGGSEFEILLDAPEDALKRITGNSRVVEAITRVRERRVNIVPGHDGEFGKIDIFGGNEKIKDKTKNMQMRMFGDR